MTMRLTSLSSGGAGEWSKLTSWRTMTKSFVSIHTMPCGAAGSSSERGSKPMR